MFIETWKKKTAIFYLILVASRTKEISNESARPLERVNQYSSPTNNPENLAKKRKAGGNFYEARGASSA